MEIKTALKLISFVFIALAFYMSFQLIQILEIERGLTGEPFWIKSLSFDIYHALFWIFFAGYWIFLILSWARWEND